MVAGGIPLHTYYFVQRSTMHGILRTNKRQSAVTVLSFNERIRNQTKSFGNVTDFFSPKFRTIEVFHKP